MELVVKQFGMEQTPPSHRYGPHVRDHYLIHYVQRGSGTLTAEGLTHSVEAGQVFVIFPGQVTVYQADAGHPWRYAWVGFVGADAAAMVAAAGATKAHPVLRCRHNLLPVVQQMQQDVALADHQLALTGGLMRFLALMTDQSAADQSASHALYEKAIWYLRSNYSRVVTIAETAHYIGLSRSQLFRVFQAETGQSPKQALTCIRLEEASRLLLDTDLNVQEIACAVGIPSHSRFSAVFAAQYGVSPSRYSRQKRR